MVPQTAVTECHESFLLLWWRRYRAFAHRLLIAGCAADHEMCDLSLGVGDELEAGRSRRRHELRFRLLEEGKLRFIEAAHEQHVAADRDHDLASRRELIDSSVGCEQGRA